MIKYKLKSNKYLVNIYNHYSIIRGRIISVISPKLYSKMLYKKNLKKELNLKNPTLFNEKLMYLKLNDYYKNKLISDCADKYEVRKYIKKCGCGEILNELYGVYDSVEDIKWDELPNKFVLKCNHGCGFNIICDDKLKLDVKEAKKKLKKWMKERFGYATCELHYLDIEPKIICEKYLETKDGILPNDYKIYCFNGEPKIILVCTEREKKLKLSFFDTEWNVMDIGTEKYKSESIPEKPKNLEKMLEDARKLSKDFKFVRADFYECEDKVIFGELTFTPAGCYATYYNEKGNEVLGNMLKI